MSRFFPSLLLAICLAALCTGCSDGESPEPVMNSVPAEGEEPRAIRRDKRGFSGEGPVKPVGGSGR
jgi:hypothetical protein